MRRDILLFFVAGMFMPVLFSISQEEKKLFILDQTGKRGIVYFNHDSHQSLVNPDPTYPFKANKEAACAGCHHTINGSGIIQLVKCGACHLEPGDTKNPVSKEGVEQSADEAFHRNCMGCHRATGKGPRLCGGCHKLTSDTMQQ